MKVRELVEKLRELPDQDAEVIAFDADAQDIVPVTGMVYGGDDKVVALQTDELETVECSHPACWGPCGKCGAHVHENEHGRFCQNCGSV